MSRRSVIRYFVAAAIALMCAQTTAVRAQETEQAGWLEGTVTNGAGQTIDRQWPCTVVLYPAQGQPITVQADAAKGGFFSVRGLLPGVYEVRVDGGTIGGAPYRPQRLWGVVVKGGVRSILKVTLHEAKTPAEKDQFEEIGQPTVPTEPVVFLPDELKRLQDQLESLVKQVQTLQEQLAALKAKIQQGGSQ